ncbi:MAG: LacI family DNA-binding transcriptional regulator [Acholeplasmataceae bacterium]|nr:LacI family DNA-binding transcriptional regulator [Acholeplasmataceae bacterium]
MATLKDIARETNVSISTVSRILTNDKTLNVSDQTRSKVLKVSENLGYQTKKNKQSKSNLTIALVHWYTRAKELEDNYYLSIRLGVEKAAHDQGIEIIKIFHDSLSQPLTPADGAIAIGKFDTEEISKFKKIYKHIVFVDSSPDVNTFDSVTIDFEHAFKEAIDFLRSQHIKKIGYIGGREYTHTLRQPIGDRREQFFKSYVKEHEHIHIGEFNIASGYDLMKKIIASNNLVDAYLIASDNMAIGALRALYEADIKVPDDVSVIGVNDIEQSAYTIPPLSTIKIYKEHMGEVAVNLLLEKIKGRAITQKVIIPTKLILRKTTKEVSSC